MNNQQYVKFFSCALSVKSSSRNAMTQELELYEIPTAGKISLNAEKLLGCDTEYLLQFLESRNISAKSLKEDLKHLEEWYAKQPHLPRDPLIQRRFFQTLVATNWSLEKTKVKIDNLYALRNKFSEILQERDPCDLEIEKYLRSPHAIILPKRTNDNERVIISRSHVPEAFDALTMYKMFFMVLEYRYMNDVLISEQWIIDCKHVTISNVVALSPVAPKGVFIWTQGYAMKVKGIHWINVPSYAEPLINVIRSMVKKKLSDRMYFHSKAEKLLDVFPKSILPSDYGGDEKSCMEINKEWADTLQSPELREWFISQNDIRTDESKRLGRSNINDTNMFGVDGSFKKLAID